VSAQAGPVLTLASSPTPSGGGFEWSYNANLSSSFQTGDFFTIYDIPGYAGSPSASPSFSISSQLAGVTPSHFNATDNSSIINVTFQYTGPTIAVSPGTVKSLGTFSFLSTIGTETEGSFAIQNSSTQVLGYVAVPGSSASGLTNAAGVLSAQVAASPVAHSGEFLQSLELDDFTDFGFQAGSYVTVYDVAGLVAGSISAPANWNCTVQLTGVTPTRNNPGQFLRSKHHLHV
jgi:hypothetical protein